MLTFPSLTPVTVIVISFTLMVAFDGSAEIALNVLSVAFSGSTVTVRVVVFPFATVPDVGVTLIALTGVILLRSSATEGLPGIHLRQPETRCDQFYQRRHFF